jgi:hypothetical protein
MKKQLFSFVVFGLAALTSNLFAASEKRTDGKPGSEYADFGSFEGDFSLGAEFGALLSSRSSGKSSFLVGFDADYRPYELFGVRFTFHQGLNSPKTSVFSLAPLLHTQISNFHPYVLGGPGIGILNAGETKAKFLVSIGVGGDVELTRHFLLGMLWFYHSIIDSSDAHSLSARISYKF